MSGNFDATLQEGQEFEKKLAERLNISAARIEIKHDSRQQSTGNMFFEIRNNDGKTPSGIDLPEWTEWLHGAGKKPYAILWASRDILRYAIHKYAKENPAAVKGGPEGSIGVIIPQSKIFQLLRDADIDLDQGKPIPEIGA